VGLGSSTIYDSVILVDALNGNSETLVRLEQDDCRAISTVTRTEVLTGTKNDLEHINTLALLDGFQAIPVTTEIADLAAALRKQFRLKTADAIIYATARSLGVPLVTRDTGFPDEADVVKI
jgi:predicted nucleic acid-binding protein